MKLDSTEYFDKKHSEPVVLKERLIAGQYLAKGVWSGLQYGVEVAFLVPLLKGTALCR